MGKIKFWTSDKLVALTALFISLLTLFIFIWQTNIISKQSHLSVMPYLILDSSDSGDNQSISITLSNHGVGPAIIVMKQFTYNDRTYNVEFDEFLKLNFPEMDSINILNYSSIEPGRAIPAGGKRNILTCGGDTKSYLTFTQIMNELLENGFEYQIEYKSIYDDNWIIETNTNTPKEIE